MTDEREGLPSASGMFRTVACPGSVKAQREAPPAPRSFPAAELGTIRHKADETGDFSELDAVQKEHARRVRELEGQIFRQWASDYGIKTYKVHREKRLWIFSGTRKSASAKIDVSVVGANDRETCVLLMDQKSGWKPVPPAIDNWQMRTAVVAQGAPRVERNADGVIIRAIIVAPHLPASPYRDFLRGNIINERRLLMHYLVLSQQPDAPRYPGTHCVGCLARANCPEAHGRDHAVIKFYQSWPVLPPAVKADLWKRAKHWDDISQFIKDRVKADIESGLEIPGLQLCEPQSVRAIAQPTKVWEVLTAHAPLFVNADGAGVTEEELRSEVDRLLRLPIGGLVKWVMDRTGWTKKATEAWVKAQFNINVTQREPWVIESEESNDRKLCASDSGSAERPVAAAAELRAGDGSRGDNSD